MPADELDELLTIDQAAEYLGVTYRTVTRWIETKHLTAVRIGPRRRRIRASDLAALQQPDR